MLRPIALCLVRLRHRYLLHGSRREAEDDDQQPTKTHQLSGFPVAKGHLCLMTSSIDNVCPCTIDSLSPSVPVAKESTESRTRGRTHARAIEALQVLSPRRNLTIKPELTRPSMAGAVLNVMIPSKTVP